MWTQIDPVLKCNVEYLLLCQHIKHPRREQNIFIFCTIFIGHVNSIKHMKSNSGAMLKLKLNVTRVTLIFENHVINDDINRRAA